MFFFVMVAVIHLVSRKIEHVHYVALSRVQKLSSVYLFNFCDANNKVSSAVEIEMYRLRESAKVELFLPLLYDIPGFNILYHNARSLH